ncbi:MAG TPA: hypothetical protein VGR69_07225 [Candidatus Rubrimentiphilum sp.]|nr:hypothetical protein [Candidatus Rubrimentiphilum sp.]
MTVSKPSSEVGRHVFGLSALAFGVIGLVWHSSSYGPVFAYAVAALQIFGGVAIQIRGTAKTGAAVLAVVYLVLAALFVPPIIARPRIFDPWGDFFEWFSLVLGPAIVYARLSAAWPRAAINRVGRILFSICVASFAAYQAVHPDFTAGLVPKWLPPNQMFWTIATTVFFALAAVALLTNLRALLATRLLTLMLAIFGLVVWVPILISHPGSHGDWSETILTFAIAGVSWILADLLGEVKTR